MCFGRVLPAHPRECGADINADPEAWFGTGSSPRVRGRQVEDMPDMLDSGLIPASAGQTLP